MSPAKKADAFTVAGSWVPGLMNEPTIVPLKVGVPERTGFTVLDPSSVMNGCWPENRMPSLANWRWSRRSGRELAERQWDPPSGQAGARLDLRVGRLHPRPGWQRGEGSGRDLGKRAGRLARERTARLAGDGLVCLARERADGLAGERAGRCRWRRRARSEHQHRKDAPTKRSAHFTPSCVHPDEPFAELCLEAIRGAFSHADAPQQRRGWSVLGTATAAGSGGQDRILSRSLRLPSR